MKNSNFKPALIMKENWNYLIILDACRYDYFSEIYAKFMSGRLEKRISAGISTVEWLKKSFTNRYPNVIYISGNPFINSIIDIAGFDAKNYFYKVIDVWDFGWNNEIGTVLPEEINKTAARYLSMYPEKRFILHYLQPHAPYLSKKFQAGGYCRQKVDDVSTSIDALSVPKVNKYLEHLVNLTGNLVQNTPLIESVWELREKLNFPPASPMDIIRRNYGKAGVKEAYTENLKIVLEKVAELCKQLSGKIVITSDHGELLGDEGGYEHPNGPVDRLFNKFYKRRKQIQQSVPWLTITGV